MTGFRLALLPIALLLCGAAAQDNRSVVSDFADIFYRPVIHVHARPAPGAAGASVFDMYRLHDGKIVEHWDAIQPVPSTSSNSHPMF